MSITYYKKHLFSLQRDLTDNLSKYSETEPSLDENSLINIGDELDTLSNNLQNDVKQKTIENVKFNKKLANIERENAELGASLNGLEGDNSGSLQMFQDVKLIYNQQLISTWILTFLFTGAGYVFLKKNN